MARPARNCIAWSNRLSFSRRRKRAFGNSQYDNTGVSVSETSNEERIDKGLSDFWEGFKADPGIMIAIYEATINGRRSPAILEKMTEFYRRVAEQLEETILAGQDLPASVSVKDIQAVVSIILWVIEGMTLHYILDPETTDFAYSLETFKKAAKAMLYRPEALASQPDENT